MTEPGFVPSNDTQASRLGFFRHRILGIILGTGTSLICLMLIFRGIDLGEVSTVLRRTDGGLLTLALIAALVNYVALATRWGILFYPHYHPDLIHLFGAQVVAQLVNTVLPGRLSPLARVGWLSSHASISKAFALSTIVMEKILDGLVYLIILLVVLAFVVLPGWVRDAGLATGVMSSVLVVTVLAAVIAKTQLTRALWRVADWVPVLGHFRVAPVIQSTLDSLDVWRYPGKGLQLVAWSGVVWGVTVLLNYLTLRALQLDTPFVASLVVLIFVQAGLRIPSSPGSIGVFHYLCVLALSLFDVSRDAALGYAIVLHLLNFLPQSLLGVAFVWQAHDRFGRWFPGKLMSAADGESTEVSL